MRIGRQWRTTPDGLRCEEKPNSRLELPVEVRGSYELSLRLRRAGKDESANIILPVGDSQVMLVIGGWAAQGHRSGLERVRGLPGDRNASTVEGFTFKQGIDYDVAVIVQVRGPNASIAVSMDGQPYLKWEGPVSDLSMHPPWSMRRSRSLGLGAMTAMIYGKAELKLLDGEAWVREP